MVLLATGHVIRSRRLIKQVPTKRCRTAHIKSDAYGTGTGETWIASVAPKEEWQQLTFLALALIKFHPDRIFCRGKGT